MAVNSSAQYRAAVRRQLSEKVLPVAQRYLVAYQFADKREMEKGNGVTWTATRFNRVPLPFAPLSEGVPPVGETLTITQVTGVALQWGDKITLTDVAVTTTPFDLIDRSKDMLGLQVAETQERNTFLNMMSGTQVNYVNQRGSRALVAAGDLLDPYTVNRTVANLKNLGAPLWNGQTETDVRRDINHNQRAADKSYKTAEHYVSIGSTLVYNDFANNATVVNAWSYSDINRLYINEAGQWRGMHFCESNIIPTFVGVANNDSGLTYTPGTSGSLAGPTYYVQVTGSDTQNQYESRIYQVSAAQTVTGPNGSIAVVLPSTTGFTYNVYIGTTSSPTNLGLSISGPTSGPYAGQATQLAAGSTVTITGVGLFQIPPAAPATGVTVFPTFIFGRGAFACLKLENISWTTLFEADKSDPLNQQRVVGWKAFWGYCILNQQFMARIESTASNTGTFG